MAGRWWRPLRQRAAASLLVGDSFEQLRCATTYRPKRSLQPYFWNVGITTNFGHRLPPRTEQLVSENEVEPLPLTPWPQEMPRTRQPLATEAKILTVCAVITADTFARVYGIRDDSGRSTRATSTSSSATAPTLASCGTRTSGTRPSIRPSSAANCGTASTQSWRRMAACGATRREPRFSICSRASCSSTMTAFGIQGMRDLWVDRQIPGNKIVISYEL